jgi:hypothetical protein
MLGRRVVRDLRRDRRGVKKEGGGGGCGDKKVTGPSSGWSQGGSVWYGDVLAYVSILAYRQRFSGVFGKVKFDWQMNGSGRGGIYKRVQGWGPWLFAGHYYWKSNSPD